NANAQVMGHPLESLAGFGITLFGEVENVLEAWAGRRVGATVPSQRLGEIAHCGLVGSENFPATPVAAAAFRALFVQHDVTEFTGQPGWSPHQLTIEHHPNADAF